MAFQTKIQKKLPVKMTLETFAFKLLDKIINAPEPAAIERYIAVALKALGNKNMNGYLIQRFIDRVGLYLNSHLPVNALQEENSKTARERLQQFRQAISSPIVK